MVVYKSGVFYPAVAEITSSVLCDFGLVTSDNTNIVFDQNKLHREKAKVRKYLEFQTSREA